MADSRQTAGVTSGGNINAGKSYPKGVSSAGEAGRVETTGLSPGVVHKEILSIPEEISVRSLATLMKVEPIAVIGKLVAGGIMASINQSIDYDTAALLIEEFGFEAKPEEKAALNITKNVQTKDAVSRPPIVTIMGHVDHGKTSLLDYIRSSSVALGEAGGITQHISAYQIEFTSKENQKRKITFIDTPGHEAFSALRSHGASITDLVVLVVAANDGVKPQTLEALKFARTANVPVMVAINKIDLPDANLERVKQQLVEHDLAPEQWGGKTVIVPVSAKTGEGVDNLLEMIILTTDLLELRADPDAAPEGIVIEANLDKQIGPVARVLVYNGSLKLGQVVVVGKIYGRIRTMTDDRNNKVVTAKPAFPVLISGLKDVPVFGDSLQVVPSEKIAKSITISGTSLGSRKASENENTFRIVLKADVGGSLAALEDSIKKLQVKDATIEILSSGIGAVNENDINMAKGATGTIIAFRATPTKRVAQLSSQEGVEIKESWVIYEIIDFLTEKLKKIATPTYATIEHGRLKILEVFSSHKDSSIAGGEVTEGVVKPSLDVKIFRSKEEVGTAKLETVKMGKINVDQVEAGKQCGLSLTKLTTMVEKGDVLLFTAQQLEK